MNSDQKVIGIMLIGMGLLLAIPYIPKFVIFILGIYLIILGIRLLKTDWSKR